MEIVFNGEDVFDRVQALFRCLKEDLSDMRNQEIKIWICRSWFILVGLSFLPIAGAQVAFEPEGGPLPDYYVYHKTSGARSFDGFYQPVDDTLPIIMLTGYWPPTNEMLRRFSADPEQNPEGWLGDDWEGRGYNIYAFFPEFPGGLGQGEGDFEVDYQDTSVDWWYYTGELDPVAIIAFGRAFNNSQWRLEGGAHNQVIDEWIDDYAAPFKPNLGLPIILEPEGFDRFSTLPITETMAALTTAGVPVNPATSTVDSSAFLCNFIGYHTSWYHDLHADPGDPARNLAAGHIHVGYAMTLETAIWATEVTVRTLITHLDAQLCVHDGDVHADDELTALDAQTAFLIALGQYSPEPAEACAADCDGSGDVTAGDAQWIFLGVLGNPMCADPV